MFTDIVGYTRMSSQNEQQTLELVENCNRLLKVYVKMFRGTWLKQVGDGTLTTFESAHDAVLCAIHIQQTFGSGDHVQLRVGIHIGDVVEKEGDVWGDGVNIASRTEGKAPNGGIAVTESVQQALISHPEIPFSDIGDFEFKGVGRSLKVFSVPLQEVGFATRTVQWPKSSQTPVLKLKNIRLVMWGALASVIMVVLVAWYKPERPADNTVYLSATDNTGDPRQALAHAWFLDQLANLLSRLSGMQVEVSDNAHPQQAVRFHAVFSAVDKKIQVSWQASSSSADVLKTIYEASYRPGEVETSVYDVAHQLIQWSMDNALPQWQQGRLRPEAIKLYFQAYKILVTHLNSSSAKDAQSFLSDALTLEPEFHAAMALRCRLYVARQDMFQDADEEWLAQAEPLCNALLNYAVDDIDIAVALAKYYVARDQFEMANMFLNGTEQRNLDWYITSSKVLAAQGRNDDALLMLDSLQQQHGLRNWSLMLRRASIYIYENDCNRAAEVYRQILANYPDKYDAQLNLASCLFNLGQLQEANDWFVRINAVSPTLYSLSNHGTTSYYLGDYIRASENFRAALALSPTDFELHGNLGDALMAEGEQQDAARVSFREALRLGKAELSGQAFVQDSYGYLLLAHYASQLNLFDEADAYFALYEKADGVDADFHYYKAISAVQRADQPSALAHLIQALQMAYPKIYIENTPSLALVLQAVPDDVLESYTMQ